MKISELAPEHIARFDEWAEKWVQIGLSTEPADFDLAIEAALKGYELANMKKPMIILGMGSPLGAILGGVLSVRCLQELKKMQPEHLSIEILDHIWSQIAHRDQSRVLDQIRIQVDEQIWGQTWDHVGDRVLDQIYDQVLDQMRDQVYDQVLDQVQKQVQKQVWGEIQEQVLALVADQVWDQVWERISDRVGRQVGGQVWSRVRDQVMNQVMDQIGDQVLDPVRYPKRSERMFGAGDAAVASVSSFYREVVGLDAPGLEQFCIFEKLTMTCGFVWWHENVLVISDRPEQIHRDAEGRLHNDRGPSISFRDGWGLYHWHGTVIPGDWVTGKPPSAAKALSWENIEQRRAACEIVGWKNIVRKLKTKVIDEDGNPEVGILFEARLPGAQRTRSRRGSWVGRWERFLQVRCGTGRIFVLPVPPHIKTAWEANAWTWGLKPHEYRPEVRT